jgi:hypothetical protein
MRCIWRKFVICSHRSNKLHNFMFAFAFDQIIWENNCDLKNTPVFVESKT